MTIKLSSGREIRANLGILGLDGLDSDNLYDGYDGMVWQEGSDWEDPFTEAERREIAELMVARWKRWGRLP